MEQELDAPVGSGFERFRPAGGAEGVLAHFLAPTLDGLGLLGRAPLVDERLHDLTELSVGRVRVGARPPDHGVLELGREDVGELRPRLVAGDDDDPRASEPPEEPLELLRDSLVVLEVEVLDVALVAGLRPAALVMPPLRLLGTVGDLLEPAAAQREHAALLAADDGDDRAVPAADQRHERAEQEVVGDAGGVRDPPRQREHAPDIVQPRREDRQPMSTVTIELLLEELAEPLEVGFQPCLDLVREVGAGRSVRSRGRVEHRVHPHRRFARRRRNRRIEVDVERDRAAVLRAEACELAQAVEADRGCRHTDLSASRARILSVRSRNISILRLVL